MTTDSTIDRLRELEQAATPGPWLWDDDPDLTQDSVWAADGDCVASTYGSAAKGSTDAADAALIAESRNALPALLAVAEAASKADVRYPSILVVEYPSEYVTMPSVDWARIASALARLGEVA